MAFSWSLVAVTFAMILSKRPSAREALSESMLLKMRPSSSLLFANVAAHLVEVLQGGVNGGGFRGEQRIKPLGGVPHIIQRTPQAAEAGVDVLAGIHVQHLLQGCKDAVDIGEHAFGLALQRIDLLVHGLGEAQLRAPVQGVALCRELTRLCPG